VRTFPGQTFVSPVWVPLIGPLFFMVKPRAVIVTERSVITVQQSRFSQSTGVGVVYRHECGSVSVEVSRWGVRIDGDEKVFGSLSTLEERALLRARPDSFTRETDINLADAVGCRADICPAESSGRSGAGGAGDPMGPVTVSRGESPRCEA
jgi:hypothetical protein